MATFEFHSNATSSGDGLASTRSLSCDRTPVGLCLNSFFDRCVSEDVDEPSSSWGEDSGTSVNDIRILARHSSASEEASPQHEDIALVVMANEEQQTWLQVKPLGANATTNVQNALAALSVPTRIADAVQFMSMDPAIRLPSIPVASVAVMPQQRIAVADDVHHGGAVPASKFVRRCSRRQRLKKDQAEVFQDQRCQTHVSYLSLRHGSTIVTIAASKVNQRACSQAALDCWYSAF